MCVIALVEDNDKRPTVEEVEAMYEANPYGAGAAWREKGHVKWSKGLDLERIKQLYKDLPIPYVLHFRVPSVGGDLKKLNHPFPIEHRVRLDLQGSTTGDVLFHNGHWPQWRDFSLDLVAKGHLKIPPDRWSDSRAMAFLASHFGTGILELIHEKVVVFGPDEIDVFGRYGNGDWEVHHGYLVSNTGWLKKVRRASGNASNFYHGQAPASLAHKPVTVPTVLGPIRESEKKEDLSTGPFEVVLARLEALAAQGLNLKEGLARIGMSKNKFKTLKKQWELSVFKKSQKDPLSSLNIVH